MEYTQARRINVELVRKISTSEDEILADKIDFDLNMDSVHQWYVQVREKLKKWHLQDLVNLKLPYPPKDDSSTWENWKYLSNCVKIYILHNIPKGYIFDPRFTPQATKYADVLFETCLKIASTPIAKNLVIRYRGLMDFSQSAPHVLYKDDVELLARIISSCNELDPTFISPLQATCILLSRLSKRNSEGANYAHIVYARTTPEEVSNMTWDDFNKLWEELLHMGIP
ncbi:uncharacterized protein AKAW2_60821A [Aspergillus luchuensis]|uniref:Uncharacterized protein n=2 Tax=Aspergillus kawachii TaxID=1069201 RepID=A0A1M3TE29_ASPLC|nr:uncharacterized protein AKAW2_60821A [Aspergillus luchuensis]OJZ84984.1 hypothetical protein ASPFODRAFT_650111 [Aspergillus luchuensis CBS 106.47]GAA86442.1 similar to An12g04100 [Aspergillus luchuensis IFO 4308]BCS02557.1 hypothetical protein AKAW2_60821A [Aspergillus luchuensis]BCS14229.1 hypothetical protein ALUC_60785A [Aspergillus luchuensis]GAT30278.1 similar to An12g04100 [Aspergillus luchuensis]